MTTGERVDPYLGFRFGVEFDHVQVGGFTSVSGLEMTLETEEYQEGGVNDYTHTLPKRTTTPNLTLERGVVDRTDLWDWIEKSRDGIIERRNVTVVLLDSEKRGIRSWQCKQAYPVKWSGPEFSADQSAVAMESLELTHQGIDQTEVR
jgi:phage tail-like protein